MSSATDRETCLQKPTLADQLDAIRTLCQEYGVAKLEVFGSFCTPAFERERSDIDFLVEYLPEQDLGPWIREHQALEDALQHLLEIDVDLIFSDALRNHWFRQEADRTRTTIYETRYASEVA